MDQNNSRVSGSAAMEITKERITHKFGSISGIDDSHDNLNRITGLSPTHIAAGQRLTSREDANLLLFLQENEEHGVYLHDMG